jgi:hypothetical protein
MDRPHKFYEWMFYGVSERKGLWTSEGDTQEYRPHLRWPRALYFEFKKNHFPIDSNFWFETIFQEVSKIDNFLIKTSNTKTLENQLDQYCFAMMLTNLQLILFKRWRSITYLNKHLCCKYFQIFFHYFLPTVRYFLCLFLFHRLKQFIRYKKRNMKSYIILCWKCHQFCYHSLGVDTGLKFPSFKVLSIDYIIFQILLWGKFTLKRILFRDSDDSNDFKYWVFI